MELLDPYNLRARIMIKPFWEQDINRATEIVLGGVIFHAYGI